MNFNRLLKHKSIFVGAVITLVLTIVGSVMLMKFAGKHGRVSSSLSSTKAKLESLNRGNPFPSIENVQVLAENAEVLENRLESLMVSLREGQIEPVAMERAAFPTLLEKMIKELTSEAEAAGVILPERFPFGFGRYTEGALPKEETIERLTVQAQSVRNLCKTLFEAGIDSLDSVTRETFEDKDAAPVVKEDSRRRRSSSRAAAKPKSNPSAISEEDMLYRKERFEVQFVASDKDFWEVLNALASSTDLFIIREVTVLNSKRPAIKLPAAAMIPLPQGGLSAAGGLASPGAVQAQPTYDTLSHEERVLMGREKISVKMTIDACRFPSLALEGTP